MTFKPNKRFKRKYNRLYKRDPLAANTLLLLAELANRKGEVRFEATTKEGIAEEIRKLLIARFNDPAEYAL